MHGPATAIYILIGKTADAKKVDLWLNDVSILPRAKVAGAEPFKDAGPIVLSPALEDVAQPSTATTAAFKVVPGQWEITLAVKPALHSPDNSYNAVVQLECIDADGKAIDRITVAEDFGEHERQKFSTRVEVPKGASSARSFFATAKTDAWKCCGKTRAEWMSRCRSPESMPIARDRRSFPTDAAR